MSDPASQLEGLEKLVLIVDDRDAQKLIATWPIVGPRQPAGATDGEDMDDRPLILEWERVSGVDRERIARLEPVLFENAILGPDGYVSSDAMRLLRVIAGRELMTRRRTRA